MGFVHFLDDIGNTFVLVCRPLRYFHRFAEFLVG
jgi:hypothetical protein